MIVDNRLLVGHQVSLRRLRLRSSSALSLAVPPTGLVSLHIGPKHGTDSCLVSPTLFAKPLQNITVDSDCELCLRTHRLQSTANYRSSELFGGYLWSIAKVDLVLGHGRKAVKISAWSPGNRLLVHIVFLSSGNKTDHVVGLRVGHRHDGSFEKTYCEETPLLVIESVISHSYRLISENAREIGEINSVLGEVGPAFVLVPLEMHK